MGCDIHWYSETKKNNVWVCDQAHSFCILKDEDDYPHMDAFPGGDRDYPFFGLLQPWVRTHWEWSFPERCELPDDLSEQIKAIFAHWGEDAHSEGYLTKSDLISKVAEIRERKARNLIDPTNDAMYLDGHLTALEETISNLTSECAETDQRIVFWFDN